MDGDDLALMKQTEVAPDRFDDRKQLLGDFDQLPSQPSIAPKWTAWTPSIARRSTSSPRARSPAHSTSRTKTPASATATASAPPEHLGDGAPMWNDQLLMARRLVEAGARVVTVAYGFWDTHGQNFRHLKQHLPLFDRGISALVEDIYARGLDRDVTVVVWGEFGRTPKINKDAGRDHWAHVSNAPALRRRHEGRPGDRLDRQDRWLLPRTDPSIIATFWPPSTTTSASILTVSIETSPTGRRWSWRGRQELSGSWCDSQASGSVFPGSDGARGGTSGRTVAPRDRCTERGVSTLCGGGWQRYRGPGGAGR